MVCDEPLYNSRIIDTFLKLIKKRYPHVNVAELLAYAGMKAHQVADQGHWFNQEQVDRFHEKLVQLSGNHAIAREAGRYAVSPDAMGAFRQNILTFVGPANTLKLANKAAANLSRSALLESRVLGPRRIELTANFREGVHEKPYQCENRIGTIEAVVMMFNYGLPKIEHPECIFNGGNICRYIISWDNSPAEILKLIRNCLAVILTAGVMLSFYFVPQIAMSVVLPVSASLFLLFALLAEHREKKGLQAILQGLEKPTDRLIDQINSNYNNAQMTNEIGQVISRETDIGGIISSLLQIMKNRIGYDRCLILLENRGRTALEYLNGFGISQQQEEFLRKADFSFNGEWREGLMISVFQDSKPVLINSLAEYDELYPQGNRELLSRFETEAFLCCPVICDGESIGVLLVDNHKSFKPLLQTDLNLLMGIAPVLGVSIRNAELLETKEQQFNAIIQLEKTMVELAAAKETSERYAESLQFMNEEVKNFAYIVSHDLRAPLVNIKGFSAELRGALKVAAPLIEKCKSSLGEKDVAGLDELLVVDVPEALGFIDSSVNRMDSLINGVLKLSRLGRRDLKPENVDVREIVEAILGSMAHQLETGRVTVKIHDLPSVVSDRTAIEQVVGNLLDNALKYLDRSRAGQLEIGADRGVVETVFWFRDNGRGIAEEDMGKVFDLFRRAGKQDMPGEGMGLAYVKALVRRMGGRIWCESEYGVGTTFSFSIPHDFEKAIPG